MNIDITRYFGAICILHGSSRVNEVNGGYPMQYKNKLHELDTAANKLLEKRELLRHIYIFGAGQIGAQIMRTLYTYNILEGFIDNDKQKQQREYKGFKVYSLEEYMQIKNGIIVIAIGEKTAPDIMQQLSDSQLVEEKDFYSYTLFLNKIFPIISLYFYNKSFVSLAQISLTERCTLKCKKCAHGCHAVDNSTAKDLTLEQVKKSADSFYSKVDFIQEFVLIGGEPLLYKDLSNVIEYIGKRYKHQIGIFSITTNGTIVPRQEIIEICKEYNIFFRISN